MMALHVLVALHPRNARSVAGMRARTHMRVRACDPSTRFQLEFRLCPLRALSIVVHSPISVHGSHGDKANRACGKTCMGQRRRCSLAMRYKVGP